MALEVCCQVGIIRKNVVAIRIEAETPMEELYGLRDVRIGVLFQIGTFGESVVTAAAGAS